jgi:glutamate N-acetyltransferase/amino-acid N-acetyltransferase
MMEGGLSFLSSGTVTSARGFWAGATGVGIKAKKEDVLDLGILYSETPCVAAAVFTANRVKAAPVILSQQRVQLGRAQAIVVNSGCANACVGAVGLDNASEMAHLTAQKLGLAEDQVLVASTGVIGRRLPMELIRAGIGEINLVPDGGSILARAIMTTDTVPKEAAVRASAGGGEFVVGGIAKGSGMIHPDLATFLCFLTTDAAVEPDFLKESLREAVANSFNMVSVDGDTSTNDMVLVMANGLSGGEPISSGSGAASVFQEALSQLCIQLAKRVAADGEGASRLVEVRVNGAASVADARLAARTIVSSPLVKTAVHGSDPNWGRVLAALGRSGAALVESKIDLDIGGVGLVRSGVPTSFDRAEVSELLRVSPVLIKLELNLGAATATAWGCDLSPEYVTINSHYTT